MITALGIKVSINIYKVCLFSGTGTAIGDPTEVNSLGGFFSQYLNGQSDDSKVLIGSVKTNIGHTESAAGVAGVIKVLLMMKHGKIVPSLHVKKDKSNLNPKIDLDKYSFDIALGVTDWCSDKQGDRISCVNSFGFGGSNSHAILIQQKCFASSKVREKRAQKLNKVNTCMTEKKEHCDDDREKTLNIVCLSAADKNALHSSLDEFIAGVKESCYSTVDIAYTSSCHRDHFSYRIGIVASDNNDLIDKCMQARESIETLKPPRKKRLVFVFCGVGTAWKGMCNELMRTEPVFKETIIKIGSLLQTFGESNILENAFLTDMDYDDPFLNHLAIFAAQVGLTQLWKSFGVFPDVVIGQSVGEVAAAYTSGGLTLKAAVDVIYYRSKILAQHTGGTMMVVGNYDVAKLEKLCKVYENRVVVAVYSSPTSCTLSGDKDIMKEIRKQLENEAEANCIKLLLKEISVKCAYHSKYVETCATEIKTSLKNLSGEDVSVSHISTVTGQQAPKEIFLTSDYWADNVTKPVLFMQAVTTASLSDTMNIFIELGPKPVLRAHLSTYLDHKTNIALPSMAYQNQCHALYGSLAYLYQIGHNVNWENFYTTTACLVPVPKYKFHKSKMLYLSEPQRRYLRGLPREESGSQHMFLRSEASDSAEFKVQINKTSTPYVYDHFLHNTILVPGATYVEAAFEIGHRMAQSTTFDNQVSVEFINPLTPNSDNSSDVEIELGTKGPDGRITFEARKNKRTFAEGAITKRTVSFKSGVDIEEIKNICTQKLTKSESYQRLEEFGFRYGESLSLIQRAWTAKSECLVEIELPESVKSQVRSSHLHPAIIDAMFQTFGILSVRGPEDSFENEFEQGPTLPKGVGSFILNAPPQNSMFVYAKETKKTSAGNHYNALLLARNGVVLAEVNDFYTRSVSLSSSPKDQDLVYELNWKQMKKRNDSGQLKTASVVVCAGKRFNAFLVENDTRIRYNILDLQDDIGNAGSIFNSFSSEVDKNTITSIIFAPMTSMQNNEDDGYNILAVAKKSLLALKDLINILNNRQISVPLMVVTECTQRVAGSYRPKVNVCGSELWGLVRSAIREVAYHGSIRILDIDFSEASQTVFQELLLKEHLEYTEYVIDHGSVYTSRVMSYPKEKLEVDLKYITSDSSEDMFLLSANQKYLESPCFGLADHMADNFIEQGSKNVQIQLDSICLHDKSIYPVTYGEGEGIQSLWPETNENGFQMIAIEGFGKVISSETNQNVSTFADSENVYFCSPCKVASVVSVPKECVMKESNLTDYKPGVLTSCTLVWALLESHFEVSTNVCIVCDRSTSALARIAAGMVGAQKGCFGVVINKENIMAEIEEKIDQLQYVKSMILLSKLPICDVQHILSQINTIDSIITIKEFMSRDLYQQIANMSSYEVNVKIHETDYIFQPSSLKKKVPKVVKWLRTRTKDFWSILPNDDQSKQHSGEEDYEQRYNSLVLPYSTFSLSEHKSDKQEIKNNLVQRQLQKQPIPLRVKKSDLFRQNGFYIIVGGLTGLGWELLNLLAEMGAGYIVTFGRRTPNEEQNQDIQKVMFKYDCRVLCMQTDITDFQGLKVTLKDVQDKLGAIPLRGVLHGGGVLADSLLENMTNEQMEQPILPKILGSWNLHLLTKDLALDFFVMHSSIVSIFGNKGQCNYGSGNAFMDSLAHYRRTIGLCGQSINWGALGVGMAVQDPNVEKQLNLQGMMLLYRYDIRTCFLYALMTNATQITFGNFDWGKMSSFGPYPSNLTSLIEHGMRVHKPGSVASSKDVLNLQEFKLLSDEAKKAKLFEIVVAVVCEVFVVERDALEFDTTFVSLGVDSMAGMTFVNLAFDRTQCRIPIVTLLSDQTTLGSLTNYLQENINCDSDDSETNTKHTLISGKIPFMQQYLLQDYVQDPDNPYWVRMADLEIKGIRISIRSWRAIVNHVLKTNPELRRLYMLDSEDGDFDSYVVPEESSKVELERVTFEHLKMNLSEVDIREGHSFDLRTQFPIRFQVATEGDSSILRVILHAVACDITSFSIIFQDIAVTTERYAKRKRLPENKPAVDINAVIQNTLKPRLDELEAFWKGQILPDMHPVSFSNPPEPVEDAYFVDQMQQAVPQHITDKALAYVNKNGITLFQYIVSLYQLLLYQIKSQDFIPVCTPISMRMHAPELRRVLTRASNVCPLVADFTGNPTIGSFILSNAQRIRDATEHSAYPFQLIQELMSDELRNSINRHSLVMDNTTDINTYRKHDQVKVNIRNVWHLRTKYEFFATFKLDQKSNKLVIEYAYNSKACGLGDGALIPSKLIVLMDKCINQEQTPISDKSLKIASKDLGEIADNILNNLPNGLNKIMQRNNKEKRPSLIKQLRRFSLSDDSVKDTDVSVTCNVDETLKPHDSISPVESKHISNAKLRLRWFSKGQPDKKSSSHVNKSDYDSVIGQLYKKTQDMGTVELYKNNLMNEEMAKADVDKTDVYKGEKQNDDQQDNKEDGETINNSEMGNTNIKKIQNVLMKRKSSITDNASVQNDVICEEDKEQDIFKLKTGGFLDTHFMHCVNLCSSYLTFFSD